ncbi:rCG29218, partial [Rattus norvegicus]
MCRTREDKLSFICEGTRLPTNHLLKTLSYLPYILLTPLSKAGGCLCTVLLFYFILIFIAADVVKSGIISLWCDHLKHMSLISRTHLGA